MHKSKIIYNVNVVVYACFYKYTLPQVNFLLLGFTYIGLPLRNLK